ncbi:MAG: lactonase family protein [Chloroflexota bacterium]
MAIRLYVGTYTTKLGHVDGKGEGIYLYDVDPATGRLTHRTTTPGLANPSYLALDARQRFLFAANEVKENAGQPGGAVSAFAIDPASGGLTPLNHQSTRGTDPCYLCVDRTGRCVLASNYSSGSVAAFLVGADGRLSPLTDFVQHAAGEYNPKPPPGPHAHSVNLSPDERFALVAELGLDAILVYRLDVENGKLTPNDPPSAALKRGAGPRHLAFAPNGRFAYVINEQGLSMTAFAYDATRGALREIQTLSTVPPGISGRDSTADVHVHPSGRFVYGSNRGHDSIVIFAVDPTTGKLSLVGHESTRGRTPRNFAIDPSGATLYAANQDTHSVVSFAIDAQTGRLTPTGQVTEVPSPVCLKFSVI